MQEVLDHIDPRKWVLVLGHDRRRMKGHMDLDDERGHAATFADEQPP
ncbi:hypothetical protein [Lentzea terrae]|nr:hypothetical protein [Lentzea terrae]